MYLDEMKLNQVNLANESRVLRGWENKAKKKAKSQRGNFPLWDMRRQEAYSERMRVRNISRYIHLARAFVDQKDYLKVEQSVREGNEPKVYEIMDTLRVFGYYPEEAFVANWLKSA